MPIYLYHCNNCDSQREVLQKFSKPPLRTCPSCGDDQMQKLFSPEIGLAFKGNGFYITDYARRGNSKAEKKNEAAAND